MYSPQKYLTFRLVVLAAACVLACLSVPVIATGQALDPPSSFAEIEGTEYPDSGYSLDARPGDDYGLSDSRLIGFWEHRDSHGTVVLEIVSENRLIIGGRTLKYYVVPGVIHVVDESGEFEYYYKVNNDRLILTLAEDGGHPLEVTFRRVNLSESFMHSSASRSMQ